MTTMIRLGARLRAARKAAGYNTSKAFVAKYGIVASTYSQHESDKRTPDEEILQFYSKTFGVDLEWLKTGEGRPYKNITTVQKNALAEELVDLKYWNISPPTLNQELLSTVIEELFKHHEPQLSSRAIKAIVKNAVAIYSDVVSSSTSSETQKQVLKPALAAYKRVAKA